MAKIKELVDLNEEEAAEAYKLPAAGTKVRAAILDHPIDGKIRRIFRFLDKYEAFQFEGIDFDVACALAFKED